MSADDHQTDPGAEETAARLRPALGRLYRRIRQTKPIGGLSLAESSALSQLRHGALTAAQLAKLEHITPQSMSSTLAGLERRGYLRREPDPDDGRRQLLSLTPEGSGSVNARRARRDRQLAAALSGFTAAECRQLLEAAELLDRLAECLVELPSTENENETDGEGETDTTMSDPA